MIRSLIKNFSVFIGPIAFLIFHHLSTNTTNSEGSLEAPGYLAIGIAIWMIFWWIAEVIPLAITSLLPIVLFPAFGILNMKSTTALYSSEVIFLFLSGFFLAIALEKTNLHIWLSRKILNYFGNSTSYLLLGFMMSTALLSMWISNTAAALIMIPLVGSLTSGKDEKHKRLSKLLLFGVGYAASIGGVATIIGSPPNAILWDFLNRNSIANINFVEWMFFGVPVASIGLLLAWKFLYYFFDGINLENIITKPTIVSSSKLSASQIRLLFVFSFVILLWTLRSIFSWSNITDASIALIGALLLFVTTNPDTNPDKDDSEKYLTEADIRKVPWGILLLFGGGIALSEGLSNTGVTSWFANSLQGLNGVPHLAVYLFLAVCFILLTEIGSNTALAAIGVTIASSLSRSLGTHELTTLTVVVFATSLSFMLPMATPPNAIIFSYGNVSMKEMMRVGIWLNLIFAVLISFLAYFLIPLTWN
jgi:sodium-dependent dicarboxylate transporter 2/3/5